MIIEAGPGDEEMLEAFLAKHFATTMFLRGNLRDFGLGNTDAPYAMRYFVEKADGAVIGVGAIANNGTLMGQATGSLDSIATLMRDLLGPIHVPAILGAQDQASSLIAAFELQDAPKKLADIEPLFTLGLADLRLPGSDLDLRRPDKAVQPLLERWTYEYELEILDANPGEETQNRALQSVKHQITTDRLRILFHKGQPVAKTAFTAVLPDCVQVGGVYTPPELRGRGFAKSAVALHLAEARSLGVCKAVLFSASLSASSVYRAIGFQQVGTFAITLFV